MGGSSKRFNRDHDFIVLSAKPAAALVVVVELSNIDTDDIVIFVRCLSRVTMNPHRIGLPPAKTCALSS